MPKLTKTLVLHLPSGTVPTCRHELVVSLNARSHGFDGRLLGVMLRLLADSSRRRAPPVLRRVPHHTTRRQPSSRAHTHKLLFPLPVTELLLELEPVPVPVPVRAPVPVLELELVLPRAWTRTSTCQR